MSLSLFDPFSELVSGPSMQGSLSTWRPALDIRETEKDIVVHADLPGVKKEDINISLEKGLLTISGEKKQEKKEQSDRFYRSERSYGSFSRTLSVPENVKEDQIKASFKDGVLEVTFPKPIGKQETSKRIAIS